MRTSIVSILVFACFLYGSCQSQWIQLESGTDKQLTSMCFLNNDTGFVVGRQTILKTVDGGYTWSINEYPGTSINLSSVDFVNDTIGFACGYEGVLIKTVDCGESWSYLNSKFSGTLYSIDFINASQILALSSR